MTKRPVPLLKFLVLGLLLAAVFLPSSGGAASKSAKLTTVHFRTGFGVGAWDGGFYTAKAKGFYQQAGLNVVIDQGQGSFSNIQLVAAGKADIVNAASPAVIQFAAQGAKVKMIASFVQSSGSGIITKPEIKSVQDLAGKTLWGGQFDFTTNLFPIYARAAHISPSATKVVTAAFGDAVQLFLTGKYDGVFGVGWGEVPIAKVAGAKFNWFTYAKAGLEYLGPGLVVSSDWLASHAAIAKAFAMATARGWEYAEEHPTEAAAIVRKVEPTLNGADISAIERVMPGYNYTPHTRGQALGRMALIDWQNSVKTLLNAGQIKSAIAAGTLFQNVIPANSPYRVSRRATR
jgi:NitT/TauT family transport system substrate-binding protein